MAKVYYPKSTSTKLTEGAVAGLLGGAVVVVVTTLVDALVPNRSWWTSAAAVGGIVTGVKDFNTASPDVGSLIVGLLLTFVFYALVGIGLVYYLPLFRNFNINLMLGGAIYGALVWLVVDLLFLNGLTSGNLNLISLLIADVAAGAVMGWWLMRAAQTGGTPPAAQSTVGDRPQTVDDDVPVAK